MGDDQQVLGGDGAVAAPQESEHTGEAGEVESAMRQSGVDRESGAKPSKPAGPAKTPRGRCAAISASGKPCGAPARHGATFCMAHDPDPAIRARWKAGQSRRGTVALAKRVPPGELTRFDFSTPETIQAALETVAKAVASNQLTPSQGTAIVHTINARLRLVEVSMDSRLAELERLVGRDTERED